MSGFSGGGGPSLAGEAAFSQSNVAPNAYGTSGIPYQPLAKAATEEYAEYSKVATVGGTLSFDILYAMSSSHSGDVVLQVDYLKTSDGSNLNAALTAQASFTFTPGTGQDTQKTLLGSSQATMQLSVSAGDRLLIRITRKNVAGDTHTGSINIVDLRWR